ncbi:LuxR C-terminal-related transcriptional regulator [uncultured Piscinibacter sp.]|uniref:helix-turn-helix transcriptional regulator n=1 Tax=uncultured Piscinibacter sp. TaxID=1131835 RepID=UPI002606154E|nr:LuxR C-terminal-related transcriptional regulator [uncultured Piscinibacter sp.]
MDLTGLATTKIQPPRARSTRIARPALDAALREAMRTRRLVLLVAPAGFGKTSALAGQIAALDAGTALAWVSLDEDDDPARLFGALAAALEPFDLPWRSAPSALAGRLGEEDGGARAAVAELVNALAASDAPHGLIVFDDLHRVQSPEVHVLLEALLERLPSQWTVVISTRVAPRLPLARWRAADELAEFGQDALRFSMDEARALAEAEQAPGLEARLSELMARTQGWPAGLRLCFAALRGRAGAAPLGTAGARPAAVDRSLFDYLACEIIDEMPIALHDFMVRSSVLPVLTAEAAAAVTGDARAAQRLDEIERRGLFVTALDADERTLVLHDLFRDALEDRLRKRFPDELPVLLRRAAAVEHDPLRRVSLLLHAGDWAAAEAALAAIVDELLVEGQGPEVSRLVAQFPAGWRERSSRLLRFEAIAVCMRWRWSEMAMLMEAAVAAARHSGDVGELRLSQAMLLAAWNADDQVERAQALSDELVAQDLPPEAELLVLDAQCTLLHDRGDFEALRERFTQVLQRLEDHGSLLNWWECSPPTSWAGLPGMAPLLERYGREALRRIGERELPVRATLHALQAASLVWAGRIDEAQASACQAEADARWLARSSEIAVALNLIRTYIAALHGDAAEVQGRLEALFTQETEHASPSRLRFWRAHVARIAVRALDLLGAGGAALRHWQSWHPKPAAAGDVDPLAARILAAEGRWADAADAFTALLPHAAELDMLGQGIELQLRGAHALLRAGRAAQAGAPLAEALQRVADAGSDGHALMAGPAVLGALAAQDWAQALDASQRRLLASLAARSAALRGASAAPGMAGAAGVDMSATPARESTPDAPEPAALLLSSREREVLERIAAGDSNKLIARALDISPHTVKRHVANILDKLALQSRGQAAAWLRANPR